MNNYQWSEEELVLIKDILKNRAADINNEPEEYDVSIFYFARRYSFKISPDSDNPRNLIYTILREDESQAKFKTFGRTLVLLRTLVQEFSDDIDNVFRSAF